MIKKSIALLAFVSFSLMVVAKSETLTIKSSLVCGMCEDNIRNGLIFEKGIKRVTFDLEKGEVYVKYNPKHISDSEIEKKITLIGYDANELKADEEAFKHLDPCCQSKDKCEAMKNHGDGHNHEDGHEHEHDEE